MMSYLAFVLALSFCVSFANEDEKRKFVLYVIYSGMPIAYSHLYDCSVRV